MIELNAPAYLSCYSSTYSSAPAGPYGSIFFRSDSGNNSGTILPMPLAEGGNTTIVSSLIIYNSGTYEFTINKSGVLRIGGLIISSIQNIYIRKNGSTVRTISTAISDFKGVHSTYIDVVMGDIVTICSNGYYSSFDNATKRNMASNQFDMMII